MNKHPNIPDSVWEFLPKIWENPRVESLVLFGSRAFGDHDERSDVDIAVIGPMISFEDWAFMRDMAYHARSLYWISLVHFDRNPKVLQARIESTGVVIYEKKAS